LLVDENGNRIEIERLKNSALLNGRKKSQRLVIVSNRETRNVRFSVWKIRTAQSALMCDRVEGNGIRSCSEYDALKNRLSADSS